MRSVKNVMGLGLAYVCLNILEILILAVGLNVLPTLTVIAAELVLITNALTLVPELAV